MFFFYAIITIASTQRNERVWLNHNYIYRNNDLQFWAFGVWDVLRFFVPFYVIACVRNDDSLPTWEYRSSHHLFLSVPLKKTIMYTRC